MATYGELIDWIRTTHGWVSKTCWIAHCKELAGLPVSRAPNRIDSTRQVPCPPEKREVIFAAFRHFRMI
jgi:hypothetical protein